MRDDLRRRFTKHVEARTSGAAVAFEASNMEERASRQVQDPPTICDEG